MPPPAAAVTGKAAKNKKKKMRKKKQTGAPVQQAITPQAQTPQQPAQQVSEDEDGESYKSGSGTECSDSDFEGNAGYRRGGYHPVHVGEVYNGRYTVLKKLGWGHFSTVWLSLDSKTGKQVALKVQKSAENYTDAAYDEIELLRTTQVKAGEVEAQSVVDWYEEKRRVIEELQRIEDSGAPLPPEGSEDAMHLAQMRAFVTDPQPAFDSYVVGLVDHFIHAGPHGKREDGALVGCLSSLFRASLFPPILSQTCAWCLRRSGITSSHSSRRSSTTASRHPSCASSRDRSASGSIFSTGSRSKPAP